MATCIRLARCGMRNQPHFRVVVADSRRPVSGKFIEVIGSYNPRSADKKLSINKERFDHWKKNGACLSRTISELITNS
ncbi:MAG: 30S ribosomal protein S16 [Deltaproteobacteria bacterium RIFCSPLOWO2_02_FULL_47_10]|nr:MAG: 30S ribosomal protein S16 [Deltaproteobacteria bacterium RIFCSPLOWO2_02_FULL_47_10]